MPDFELLGPDRLDALRRFLSRDPMQNVYALGILEEHRGQPDAPSFHGTCDGALVTSACVVAGSGGLVIPCVTDLNTASAMGRHLASCAKVRGIFGERAAVDALARGAGSQIRVNRAQRLFAATADDLGPFVCPEMRPARLTDIEEVLALAVGSFRETYGMEPPPAEKASFLRRIEARIAGGRTMVFVDGARIVMKIDVGIRSRHGAELEGIYTAAEARGKGHATRMLGQLSRSLLSSLPRLTIRVDERDPALTAVCRKVGYVPMKPQRLLLVE